MTAGRRVGDHEHHVVFRPGEADAWRDADTQRRLLARVDTYRDEGPPPPEERMTREEIRTRFGV